MKDENKKFLLADDFYNRVKKSMEYQGITIDDLHYIINHVIGYEITKNNLNIYIQRIPNVNFLIALSKALNTSSDYLLGIDKESPYKAGFDYKYGAKKYTKYEGDYYIYFYPTVSNSPTDINEAYLSIKHEMNYTVEMIITTTEGREKKYTGKLLLSNSYSVGYISLQGEGFGEIVNMSFCDPTLNTAEAKVELLVGAMLSISSGNLKRVPVMSRFILSRDKIPEDKYDCLKSNLTLNTKYINITQEMILKSLDDSIQDTELKNIILKRLLSAFIEKNYYVIEESFIINTLKKDYNLSSSKTMQILTSMRINSLSNANSKLNRTIDARLFYYLKD